MRRTLRATARILAAVCFLATAALASGQESEPEEEEEEGAEEGEEQAVRFHLPEIEAHPGERVSLPFSVDTTAALSMTAFSVQHDPRALRFREPRLSDEVRAVLELNPDAESQFIWFADAEGGWFQVSIVLDYLARPAITIPVGTVPVAALELDIAGDAAAGRYELSFVVPETAEFEGHFDDPLDQPVYNSARREGKEFEEETEYEDEEDEEPALSSGAILVSIIGDVSVFFRGDANADRFVDVSDPVRILGHLFSGDPAPPCQDAADANDDGRIDLSDAVSILQYLFVEAGSSAISTWAQDPTPDPLTCSVY
jgi:hypothetical protein